MTLSFHGVTASRASLVASLALVGTLTGCGYGGWTTRPTYKETRELNAEYLDHMGLKVETTNGSIAVTRADDRDDVQITATIKAISEERLTATQIAMDHDTSGRLVVHVLWPDSKRLRNEGCSFDIQTPGAYGVRLTSRNGSISIAGLEGEAILDTTNGRLTAVDHVGDVNATTSNGRVTLERVEGAMVARTSNGRVRLIDVNGSVDVDTSNGGVTVELAESADGPVRIDTSNGGVKLVLSPVFAGQLVLDTSNGGISYDVARNVRRVSASKHHATLQIGDDGPTSIVSTNNGSIDVEFAGEDD